MEPGHRWWAYGFYRNGHGPPRKASTLLGLQSGWFPWHSVVSTSETIQAAKKITGHGRQQDRMGKGTWKAISGGIRRHLRAEMHRSE